MLGLTGLIRVAIVGGLSVGVVAQQCECPNTPENCLSVTLNCSSCGLSLCMAGGEEGAQQTDQLNACRMGGSISISCRAARDPQNNLIVCGNAQSVQQCYQRLASTTGYKCSDGSLTAYTATICCNN